MCLGELRAATGALVPFDEGQLWDIAEGVSFFPLGQDERVVKENIQAMGTEKPVHCALIVWYFQDEANGFCVLPSSSPFGVWTCCQENTSSGTLP